MGKKKSNNIHLISAGVMTGTSVLLSPTQRMLEMDNSGIEVGWTGNAVGVIQILGSNSNINFYALTFSPALTQPAGVAGGYLINVNQFPFAFLKVQYTNTSGTGVFDVYISSKDVN